MGNKNKAAMYHGTSGDTIGKVYKAPNTRNAKEELSEFVNEWLDNSVLDYKPDQIEALLIAYQVEKGFIKRKDHRKQINRTEQLLNRRIYEDNT